MNDTCPSCGRGLGVWLSPDQLQRLENEGLSFDNWDWIGGRGTQKYGEGGRTRWAYKFAANLSLFSAKQTQTREPNAYPLGKLLGDAENIIKNAIGECAKLLGKNALAGFQERKKQFEYDPKNLNVPSTSAARTYEETGNVYLNPWHYVFNPDSRSIVPIPKGISKKDREFYELRNATPELWAKEIKNAGVSEYSYAVGAILHEFLHQTGKFEPHTVGTSESVKDQRKVIEKCIKGNEPK